MCRYIHHHSGILENGFKRVFGERYDLYICMNVSYRNLIVIEDRHFGRRARHSVQFHIWIRWPQIFSSFKMAFNLIRVVSSLHRRSFHFCTRDIMIIYILCIRAASLPWFVLYDTYLLYMYVYFRCTARNMIYNTRYLTLLSILHACQ